MSNLLKYALVLPEHPAEMSTECYLSTLFVDAIRSLLKNTGVSSKRDEQEMSTGDILVAYRNQLFKIGYDYCVMEAVDGFDAIGSGNEIALGVMHATRYLEVKPLARIQLALEAAEWLNNGVRGPFTVGTLQDAQVTLGVD